MTRFIILVLTLFLTTSEAYAEWVKTAESDDATGYGDPDTIRSKGNLVKMWILYDYKTIQTVAGDSYLSQKMQWEYDCAEEQSRLIAGYSYSGQMGTGKIIFSKTSILNFIYYYLKQTQVIGHQPCQAARVMLIGCLRVRN
jgi:hypothetical protein